MRENLPFPPPRARPTSCRCRTTARETAPRRVPTPARGRHEHTPVRPGVSTGANTGWIGSNGFNNGAAGYNYKTVTFRFGQFKFVGTAATPKVFEMDIDTDRGRGVSGDLMASMVVRVTLLGGATYTGVLETDTTTANRSSTGF